MISPCGSFKGFWRKRETTHAFVICGYTDAEWEAELKGFIENYEFPCVGAWDGFHVYWKTNLENHYSFKRRYSFSNMALRGYNKRFLAATVGAPGNTHDARLLKYTKVYKEIKNGELLPDKSVNLGSKIGSVPLITVGDDAFPSHPWLVKAFTGVVRDDKKRLFNVKLRSARVVTENAYGMLKGRWRLIYKKVEMKKHNLKYVMSCITLHNLCIRVNDPCEPRWRLEISEMELGDRKFSRQPSKEKSYENREKICNWLWQNIE